MNGVIIKNTELMESDNKTSMTLKTLMDGERVEIVKPRVGLYYNPYLGVKTEDGVSGYIKQESIIELGSKYIMIELKSDVYISSSKDTRVLYTLKVTERFTITDVVVNDTEVWYQIKDSNGRPGYISSDNEFDLAREVVDQSGRGANLERIFNELANSGVRVGIEMLVISGIVMIVCIFLNRFRLLPFMVAIMGVIAIVFGIYKKKRY
ncbi:MAG: SH3 domain-containing protein [Bacillota bacterium]|nr:SH3 domain-containing protein [Bacillota bacterium]